MIILEKNNLESENNLKEEKERRESLRIYFETGYET